jgi:glycosyltransferase involved in cell wall biosynthesis
LARVLAIGLGPLLRPGVRHIGGQCLRTWHFVRPLLEAGHEVVLVASPVGDVPAAPADVIEELEHEGFPYRSFLTKDLAAQRDWLDALLARERFDALLAINTYPAQLAATLATRLPAWADLNGWVMAEAQGLAVREGGREDNLRWAWRQEKAAIWRADRISTVSEAQRLATFGELAALGRLGSAWSDPRMIAVIPNACAPLHIEIGARRLETLAKTGRWPLAPGESDNSETVWALWSGGFNVWTDADALIRALGRAFAENSRLRLMVTGGAIEGYHSETYDTFRVWAERPDIAPRVRLLGWLPSEEMAAWHAAAHVGVNFDAPSLEAVFGARNRLTNMAAGALPLVSSLGAEVAKDFQAAGVGWFFPPGDADCFAEALLAASRSDDLFAMGQRAREAALDLYRDSRTVAPLLEWLLDPQPAADHAERQRREPDPRAWQHLALNDAQLRENLWLHEDAEHLRRDAGDLWRLRSKWLMRVWRGAKSLLGRRSS